jgi:hypothetical protein
MTPVRLVCVDALDPALVTARGSLVQQNAAPKHDPLGPLLHKNVPYCRAGGGSIAQQEVIHDDDKCVDKCSARQYGALTERLLDN